MIRFIYISVIFLRFIKGFMVSKMYLIFILSVFTITIFSCKDNPSGINENVDLTEQSFIEQIAVVDTIIAKKTVFEIEILSNGKVQAREKSQILFETDGLIKSIKVKNGEKVSKGTLLATLDRVNLNTKLEQARINLEKASIEMQDILLGFGYKINDTVKVAENILKNIKIRSNYSKSLSEYREAKQQFQLTDIRAPFTGVIANLKAKPKNMTSVYDNVFCTLINTTKMEVIFPILESELYNITRNQEVGITSYTQSEHPITGKIIEINPIVDENGMVEVKATIDNENAALFDGMNVKVKINQSVHNQLVLPKTAVLKRQNRNVVFIYNNGEAKWVYVDIGQENTDMVVITKGIKENERVIVSGNQNLAHNSPVSLRK